MKKLSLNLYHLKDKKFLEFKVQTQIIILFHLNQDFMNFLVKLIQEHQGNTKLKVLLLKSILILIQEQWPSTVLIKKLKKSKKGLPMLEFIIRIRVLLFLHLIIIPIFTLKLTVFVRRLQNNHKN